MQPATRFLRLPEVCDLTGLCKSAIYTRIKQKQFPPPIKLGRVSAWPLHNIAAWQAEQLAGQPSR